MKAESSVDQVDYMDSETLAHGIKRRMSSSDERESDVMPSDDLSVGIVEVIAGGDEGNKKVKVNARFSFKSLAWGITPLTFFNYSWNPNTIL